MAKAAGEASQEAHQVGLQEQEVKAHGAHSRVGRLPLWGAMQCTTPAGVLSPTYPSWFVPLFPARLSLGIS